jgi:hypothetical protein
VAESSVAESSVAESSVAETSVAETVAWIENECEHATCTSSSEKKEAPHQERRLKGELVGRKYFHRHGALLTP